MQQQTFRFKIHSRENFNKIHSREYFRFKIHSGEDLKFKIHSGENFKFKIHPGRRTHCYGAEKASVQVGFEAGGSNSLYKEERQSNRILSTSLGQKILSTSLGQIKGGASGWPVSDQSNNLGRHMKP